MKKNDVITLEITDINNFGHGVGRHDGIVVFVSGAVSGDTARVKIIKANKSWCVGKLEEIIVSSPHRTAEKFCEAPDSCGGCAYRNITYEHELDRKREYVKNAFRKCGIPDADVWFLVGGTQSNAVVISTMLQRHEGVIAAETGHIGFHEAGAIE